MGSDGRARLGVWIPMAGPGADREASAVQRARDAEDQGWDAVWLVEPQGIDPAGVPPTLAASHLAAVTDRIRIGVLFHWPAALHPLRLAEDVAMVDVVSDGRVDWGLVPDRDVDPDADRAALGRRIEQVRDSWRAEGAALDGAAADAPRCVPAPAQQGGPPLSIACRTAADAALAVAHRARCIVEAPIATVDSESGAWPGVAEGEGDIALVVTLAGGGSDPASGALAGDAAHCRSVLARLIADARPNELMVRFAGDAVAAQRAFIRDVAPGLSDR